MLDAYFDGFEDYLRTGNSDALVGFTEGDTNPAFLSVYRNGYLKTCTDALASSYPVVQSLVGEDYFRGVARAYVEAHPPTKGTLVGYGKDLAEFLRSRSDKHELVYLADAAAIDEAWLSSYFAEEVSALTAADIESMNSEGIDVSAVRVTLTPPTRLVSLDHHIAATWALLREQGALTQSIRLEEGGNVAMLWRLNGKIHIKELDPAESAFMSKLAETATLEAAATKAFEIDEAFDLSTTFSALLQNYILRLEHNQQ